MSSRLFITGALGHIGSHLIRELQSKDPLHIVMLDNLESQRYCSLVNLPPHHRYRFIQDDVRTCDFSKLLEGVDAVIHLAAITNAEGSFERDQEVEEVNFKGLQRVAEACLTAGTPLLFPSTTSVYGSQSSVVNEDCAELKPQSPYAKSKLDCERFLSHLGPKGLRFIICRFGTIFGPSPGMRFHTAVNKFIWQAINNQPLTVWKTAWQQRRPYLDVRDCIAAINFILRKNLFDQQVYNVLTKNFTVEDIVSVIRVSIPNLHIEYVDSRIMNQLSYDVDDTKFRKLGFAPSGDLNSGVQATIDQFRSLISDQQ